MATTTTRIGIIADTHMPPWDKQIMRDVERVFEGVDLILHAGDMVTISVLDWLEEIAPVVGALGNNDTHLPEDSRLKRFQQLEQDGVSIAMFHIYEPWEQPPADFMKRHYALASPPDVIIVGDTHYDIIEERDGVLLINPGSPTSRRLRVDIPGTVAILTIEDGIPSAEIVPLSIPNNGRQTVGF